MLLGEKKINKSLTEIVSKKKALTLEELELCLFHLTTFKMAAQFNLLEWKEIHVLNVAIKVQIEALKHKQRLKLARRRRIMWWVRLAIILEAIACTVIILLVIKEILEKFSI